MSSSTSEEPGGLGRGDGGQTPQSKTDPDLNEKAGED